MTDAEKEAATKLGDNRADFMKRWFAIAISVGFATALSNMPWLKTGVFFRPDLPVDWDQVKQGARLVAAAVATILSWDGYFQSILKKPLTDSLRFPIDIFLVFLYLFLLLTSKFEHFWLSIHALSFAIYCVWDFLSVKNYRSEYINKAYAPNDFYPSIAQVYIGSFTGDRRIYCSPAITLLWPIYFFSLPIMYWLMLQEMDRSHPATTFVYAILVIIGLFSYRYDKRKRLTLNKRVYLIGLGLLLAVVANCILRHFG